MASAKHIPQPLNQLLGTLESYQQARGSCRCRRPCCRRGSCCRGCEDSMRSRLPSRAAASHGRGAAEAQPEAQVENVDDVAAAAE